MLLLKVESYVIVSILFTRYKVHFVAILTVCCVLSALRLILEFLINLTILTILWMCQLYV